MTLTFTAESIWWRGPAPFFYVPVPTDPWAEIKAISAHVTYGWGVIPVKVRIGNSEFTTSLFPKNGVYLVPVKKVVQVAESLSVGEPVTVHLTLDFQPSLDD